MAKILKLKYIESERKKSHSTRFAKQNFVFELMQLRVLQDNLGPLLAVWPPPNWGVWGAAATALRTRKNYCKIKQRKI